MGYFVQSYAIQCPYVNTDHICNLLEDVFLLGRQLQEIFLRNNYKVVVSFCPVLLFTDCIPSFYAL